MMIRVPSEDSLLDVIVLIMIVLIMMIRVPSEYSLLDVIVIKVSS